MKVCEHCRGEYEPRTVRAPKTGTRTQKFCSSKCADKAKQNYPGAAERRANYRRRVTNSHRYQAIRKFKISDEQYDELMTRADGKCEICGHPEERAGRDNLSIDHNHTTLEIRGVLCSNCNHALGKLRDDPAVVLAAFMYLNRLPITPANL
jgi:hypothetical protein